MRSVPPFAELEQALRELVLVEHLRLANMERMMAAMVRRGELEPSPPIGLAGLRWRLDRVRDVTELLGILKDHEAAARALDARLILPPEQGAAPVNSPEI